MDIQTATVIVTALIGLCSPIIVQVSKQYIKDGWTESFSVVVSIILGLVAVALVGGFTSVYSVAGIVSAVVAVSQIAYTLINKAVGGKASKSYVPDPPSDDDSTLTPVAPVTDTATTPAK